MATEILKTLVGNEDGLNSVDTLKIGEQLWLVPEWIDDYPTPGFSRPALMIRIDQFPLGRLGDELVLQYPMPKAVVDGESTAGYEVVVMPDHFVEHGDPGIPQ